MTVTLRISGREFAGWTAISVQASITQLAHTASFQTARKLSGIPALSPFPYGEIAEVLLDDQLISTIEIEAYTRSSARTEATISGRSPARNLIDCPPKKSIRRRTDLVTLTRDLAAEHDIEVLVTGPAVEPTLATYAILPNELVGAKLVQRAHEDVGVVIHSDERGRLIIQRPGVGGPVVTLDRSNCTLEAATDYSGRYRTIAIARSPGTDGSPASVAEATDPDVRPASRRLFLIPQNRVPVARLRQRVNREIRMRSNAGETLTASTSGWYRPDGAIWRPGALCWLAFADMDVEGAYVAATVTYSLDEQSGRRVSLQLVDPDVFLPA